MQGARREFANPAYHRGSRTRRVASRGYVDLNSGYQACVTQILISRGGGWKPARLDWPVTNDIVPEPPVRRYRSVDPPHQLVARPANGSDGAESGGLG